MKFPKINIPKMNLKMINDEASATLVIWGPVMILFGCFLFAALGICMDRLSGFQASFAAANPQ